MKRQTVLLLLLLALVLAACGGASAKTAGDSAPIVPELIISTPDVKTLERELNSPTPVITPDPVTGIIPTPTPEPTPTPVVTPDPTRYIRIDTSKLIHITKQPGGETLRPGDSALFTSLADNITSYQWRLVAPDYDREIVWNAEELATEFPGLTAKGGATFKLELSNIPAELDGWYAVCLYTDRNGDMKASDGALIHMLPASKSSAESGAAPASVTVLTVNAEEEPEPPAGEKPESEGGEAAEQNGGSETENAQPE